VTDPQVTIRLPRQAYLGFAAIAFSTLPLVFTSPWLALLWLIPVIGVLQVRRTGLDADRSGVTVRTLRGTRPLGWDSIRGLRMRKNKVWAVLTDGSQVRLPVVRPRHLPVLSAASGGRLPDPSAQ
jgi:hypothetical protein